MHRSIPRWRGATAAHRRPSALFAGTNRTDHRGEGDVFQVESAYSCRREFDGEREAIEAATDPPKENTCAIGVERCLRSGASSLSEQAHPRVRVDLRTARIWAHHRQWCESVAQLVQDPQRLPTRREHTEAWEPSGEALNEVSHGAFQCC